MRTCAEPTRRREPRDRRRPHVEVGGGPVSGHWVAHHPVAIHDHRREARAHQILSIDSELNVLCSLILCTRVILEAVTGLYVIVSYAIRIVWCR